MPKKPCCAINCSGDGAGGGSSFTMFHHCGHLGAWPPSPARAFRVAERQPHLEGEIGAQEVRHVGAVRLNDQPFLILAQAQMIEQHIARRIAQHLMHRLPRRRFIERRVEQCLDPCGVQIFRLAVPGLLCGPDALAGARSRLLLALHDDLARHRRALRGCALAHEYRAPLSGSRRRDLGKPEIRRPAMPVARCGRDMPIRRNQRQLAFEGLLSGEHHAQGRALPRRHG